MPADKGYGFNGKILRVDLSTQQITEQPTPLDLARQLIGGAGLASRLLYPLLEPAVDPLGPENPLLLLAGPLTGTKVPCAGRLSLCARSPLTKLWGECNIGGNFGAYLRHAGYDGILITGKADKPTYLAVLYGQAELRDATHLWNRCTFETQEMLHREVGERRMATLTIGPAGENLVKYANIMSEGGRAAGRMGLGAVMGSKNLKAMVAAGDQQVPVADQEGIIQLARTAVKAMMEDFQIGGYRDMGTAMGVGPAQEIGAMPNKYWTEGEFPTYDNISGPTMMETITVGRDGCYRCPIMCGRVIEIPEGKYRLPRTSGPEYESLGALGSMILCDNLEAVAYAAHLCDDLGLDTISCGTTIAFAYYLMEKGKLSKGEVGMELRWGDPEPQHKLIHQIAHREGFGDILAEGTRHLGERYGAPEHAVHVKGLELACWDPRALFGMAAAFATSPRGGCHLDGDMYWVLQGQVIPELGIDADDPQTDQDMGKVTALSQNWRMVSNSLIICQFVTFTPQEVAGFYTHATGIEVTPQDLMLAGERIVNMKRLVNLKLGLKPEDDTLPPHILKPLPRGGTQGKVPNLEKQLEEYYQFRQWDRKTGRPKNEKLAQLGLLQLAENMKQLSEQ